MKDYIALFRTFSAGDKVLLAILAGVALTAFVFLAANANPWQNAAAMAVMVDAALCFAAASNRAYASAWR